MKRAKVLVAGVMGLCIAACGARETRPGGVPKEWVLVKPVGAPFLFWGLADLKGEKVTGLIDSLGWKYESSTMSATLHYGYFGDVMKDAKYTREEIEVSERKAVVATGDGEVGLYVSPRTEDRAKGFPVSLVVRITCAKGAEKEAKAMVRSVRF